MTRQTEATVLDAPTEASTPPSGVNSSSRSARLREASGPSSVRANLRYSVLDGVGVSVMAGLGEWYFGAFALALGLGEIRTGLVASLPMIVGAVLQLASPWAVREIGSNRRWVAATALAQGLMFVPLAIGGLMGALPAWALFAVIAAYHAAGLSSGPAWNTWIETLVPRRIRARFFARRTRTIQGASLLALLAGGPILDAGTSHGLRLETFALLFFVSCLARVGSAYALHRHTEPVVPPARDFAILDVLRRLWTRPEGRVIGYLLSVQLAMQISGPYFTPLLLGHLGLSYTEFMVLLATSSVARMIFTPFLGELASRYGARRLLMVGGVGIVPLALLIVASSSLPVLFVVQLLSGLAWGAYDLGSLLILFESIPHEDRTSILTIQNLANATALVLGSLLGATLMSAVDDRHLGYVLVFGVSFVARAATLLLLRHVPGRAIDGRLRAVPLSTDGTSAERMDPTGR